MVAGVGAVGAVTCFSLMPFTLYTGHRHTGDLVLASVTVLIAVILLFFEGALIGEDLTEHSIEI